MAARVTTETDDLPDDLADDTAGSAEPSLEALLDKAMGGGGWPELNSKTIGQLFDKQLRDQQQALRKDAMIFRECFSTKAGRRVLEIMLDQTLRQATWPVAAIRNIHDLTAFGIWREGQNALIANIIEAIAMAKNTAINPRSNP